MELYRTLGIRPLINAAGTLTSYGGSLMPAEVTDAMAAAARAFVDMDELHRAAGTHIAALLGVEAAHICSCAAAGISLMAAACITGTDRARVRRLPDTAGLPYRFVVQSSHRNPFDQALRLAGGELVNVSADADELRQALQAPDVAGAYYTHAWFCFRESLPLHRVAELAHAAGVPLIVDAAAELPPIDNLTRFLAEGADLVTFSGGKMLRGPQSSGLILGRAGLVEACRLNDGPNMGVGRPMKVGKEEIAGLVKAVELYVAKDHAAERLVWERRVQHIIDAVADLPGVRAWQQLPYGVGQLIPHAAVTWEVAALGLDVEQAAAALRAGEPPIVAQAITPEGYGWAGFTQPELRLHPHTLQEGQDVIVARRLREILVSGH